MAKLTEDELLAVQASFRAGESIASICRRLGLDRRTVGALVAGERVASEIAGSWPPPRWKNPRQE